ncbi:hypothetical protein [Ralstonia solanacearum]|uniref:hypothetical protein n=1 Tax=Ralstonia solanacearum TaxID=305 RepID=UPI00068D0C29|nr:hypothetical protein [Ralstonia solanacearum]
MRALQQIATILLMLLVLVQSTIVVWKPARGVSMWRAYPRISKQALSESRSVTRVPAQLMTMKLAS